MLREFTDKSGARWRVWESAPVKRVHESRFTEQRSYLNVLVASLCFESAGILRRLSPVPTGWEDCDTGILEALCKSARMEKVAAARVATESRVAM